MSRTRLVHALALLGILITTGGCAASATAPEAASADRAAASADRSTNPTQADTVAAPKGGDDVSVTGGYIGVGH